DVGCGLALDALGHDLDRVEKVSVVRRADVASDAALSDAPAGRAATLLRTLLDRCGVNGAIADRACWLVRHHETGGDPEADVLRDADNLSWFRTRLPSYLECEGRDETLEHCRWVYECLSPAARSCFPDIRHAQPKLDRLLAALREEECRQAPPAGNKDQRWRAARPE